MLAKTARLTESGDFARATKSGFRYSSTNFVGYLYTNTESNDPTRVGLIISKSVGNAVTRNRLIRKIRHCIGNQYSTLPHGGLLVIRGLSNSAKADCAVEIAKIISNLILKSGEKTGKR